MHVVALAFKRDVACGLCLVAFWAYAFFLLKSKTHFKLVACFVAAVHLFHWIDWWSQQHLSKSPGCLKILRKRNPTPVVPIIVFPIQSARTGFSH